MMMFAYVLWVSLVVMVALPGCGGGSGDGSHLGMSQDNALRADYAS